GVGYLPRFFYEQWKDYTKRQIESYRLAEMAFGNAGFMQDPFITYPSDTEIRRDYCFLKHIQKWIFSSNVLSIEYFVDEGLAELSHALKLVLPDTTFDNVTKVLRERLTRLRIKYDNGLTLYINYSGSEWYILYDGVIYRLPPNGFFVDVPGKFRAYYAAKGSEEIKDYVCPAENICSTCGEPMDVGVDSSEDIPSDIDNYKDASDIELKDLIPIDDREYTDELYILDIAVNDAGIKDEFAYEDTLFSDIPDNGSGIDITLDYVLETSADEEDILKDTFLEDIQSDGREDTVYETTKDVLSHTATDTYQNDLNNTSEGCSCNLVGY
ncbi:MAG: hypothetical protein N2746_06200, partial [Deltaproteobacteria bacterium]|nr:hypothetical protein [Deltaproteobacteria bacterium]